MSDDEIEAVFREAAGAAESAFYDARRSHEERHRNALAMSLGVGTYLTYAIGAAVAAGIARVRRVTSAEGEEVSK